MHIQIVILSWYWSRASVLTAADQMYMCRCDEDVASLAVQPDASSSIQLGGEAAAQTRLAILCTSSPQNRLRHT